MKKRLAWIDMKNGSKGRDSFPIKRKRYYDDYGTNRKPSEQQMWLDAESSVC